MPHWKATLEGAPFRRANNATGVIRRYPAATADNRRRLFALPGPEIQERFARGAFLAHEQQRNHRREQLQRYRQAQRLGFGEDAETLAEGAVADLVVVLQKQHEGVRRQVGTRFAARPAVAVGFAPVDEALGPAARQAAERLGGVLVVAGVLPGGQEVGIATSPMSATFSESKGAAPVAML